MPFDGQNHRGAQLIPRIGYHPEAIAQGSVLSSSLAAAYMVSRHSPCQVGLQNYFVGRWFSASSFVDLARFRRYLPEHATHIFAEIKFRNTTAAEDGQVLHRVACTVGGATDTGETFTDDVDAAYTGAINYPPGATRTHVHARTPTGRDVFFIHEFVKPTQTARCVVELDSVSLPSQMAEITISGYSLTKAGTAGQYAPHQVVAWWACLG